MSRKEFFKKHVTLWVIPRKYWYPGADCAFYSVLKDLDGIRKNLPAKSATS